MVCITEWKEKKEEIISVLVNRHKSLSFYNRVKETRKDVIFCISLLFAWGSAAPAFEQGQVHCACPWFEEH